MQGLSDWLQAPSIVLSCPGPLRRQPASLLKITSLQLPQVFLGAESQLLAFAAAFPALRDRFFFAPLPEMFSAHARIASSLQALDASAADPAEIVHLRFGPVREARILKGVRNAAVIVEAEGARPLSTGYHPFASGRVLPASMEAILRFTQSVPEATPIGQTSSRHIILPQACITADLTAPTPEKPRRSGRHLGLDLVSLAEFSSWDWAARNIPPDEDLLDEVAGTPAVLLPWNMAHYGSILPELLGRLLQLAPTHPAAPRFVLLPFNYLGQTGIIRALITGLKEAAEGDENALRRIALARVTALGGLVTLRRLAKLAWIDGTDPEAWWTSARLDAADFALLQLGGQKPGSIASFPTEDTHRVEADSRFGPLSFESTLPSWRGLRDLLESLPMPGRTKAGGGRRRTGGR